MIMQAEEEVEQHIYLAKGSAVAMVEVAGVEGGVLLVDIQLLKGKWCAVAMVEGGGLLVDIQLLEGKHHQHVFPWVAYWNHAICVLLSKKCGVLSWWR